MKTSSIATVLVTLCVASAHAAKPNRKRTQTRHKSLDNAQAETDESYEPYLGMDQLTRKLMAHGDHSMSMSMSMPHDKHADDHAKPSGDAPPVKTDAKAIPGEDSKPDPDLTPPTDGLDTKEESG